MCSTEPWGTYTAWGVALVPGGKVMLAGFYQVGGAFQRFGTGGYLNDASVALLADTLVGPIAIGYGYGESGQNRVYFSVGGIF